MQITTQNYQEIMKIWWNL